MASATVSQEKADNNLEDILIDVLNSLSAIKELSEINCQAGSEQELLKKALNILLKNYDMESCSFFLLNEDQVLVNSAGLSDSDAPDFNFENARPLQFKIGEGIIGQAAKQKKLQHCANCLEDERFINKDQLGGVRLRGSVISVPVMDINMKLLGVLNISHPQPYFFSDWHIRLLEVCKNLLGVMLSNFRMLHDMEQLLAERTSKLEKAFEEIKLLKDHYENISIIDELTGLYNRRYFYDRIEGTLAECDRYGQSLCVLMLDIDHFKKINDTYGHAFGDQVLVAVAETLKKQVRNSDVLARFGGEEFVIIFTNTDCQKGQIFSERIRESVRELSWSEDGIPLQVSLSIGLYCLHENCHQVEEELDIDQIMHFADLALYEAKKRGRNRVVKYLEEMDQF